MVESFSFRRLVEKELARGQASAYGGQSDPSRKALSLGRGRSF